MVEHGSGLVGTGPAPTGICWDWRDWLDVVWLDTFDIGTCYEYRHPVDEARHGLGGALRGRSPRTREGRIGPTAQNCSG